MGIDWCFGQFLPKKDRVALDELKRLRNENIKLREALRSVPDKISNKSVSMAAWRILRDHIEDTLGYKLGRFDFLGKRSSEI